MGTKEVKSIDFISVLVFYDCRSGFDVWKMANYPPIRLAAYERPDRYGWTLGSRPAISRYPPPGGKHNEPPEEKPSGGLCSSLSAAHPYAL